MSLQQWIKKEKSNNRQQKEVFNDKTIVEGFCYYSDPKDILVR